MTIIVEDGTGVTGANSYVSLAEYQAYCFQYGVDNSDDAIAEVELHKAMDYLEAQNLKGTQKYPDLDTHFPATDCYINGVLVLDTVVPKQAKRAENEIALSIHNGIDPLGINERVIKQDTFGPSTTIYATEDVETNPRIDLYLNPLLDIPLDDNAMHFTIDCGDLGFARGCSRCGSNYNGTCCNYCNLGDVC